MLLMPRMTLREARNILGLTQHQLAERAGVKRSAIDDFESGRVLRPAYTTVLNIFNSLQASGLRGLSLEDVFPLEPEAVETRRKAS